MEAVFVYFPSGPIRSSMILLTFPEFNQHSTPLLILIVQGYLLAILLLLRFRKKGRTADLWLALLLSVQGFNSTSYIIGFMGWYDTFTNTKVNYFLISLYLALGPFIYLYVRSLTRPTRGWHRRDWWHLTPIFAYISYRLFVWLYDKGQPGYWDQQNGAFEATIDMVYVDPFLSAAEVLSIAAYLIATGVLFLRYRERINAYFSNTYRVELRWIRNFLVAYACLFVFQYVLMIIDTQIISLHWTQRWWGHILSAIVILYVGFQGYYTNLDALYAKTVALDGNFPTSPGLPLPESPPEQKEEMIDPDLVTRLQQYMEQEKPWLNPELTLNDLASELNLSSGLLSQIINKGLHRRFNEYINHFRLRAVKQALQEGAHRRMSLLGIALDCGFNSKATFNRVFRKQFGQTPSEFLRQLDQSASPTGKSVD